MVKLKKRIVKGEIPIFFSTDDNYIPFLDVAIKSLIANASKKYQYKIIILNSGLKEENMELVEQNENDNFTIEFADVTDAVKDLKDKLPNQYHFGLATWYRLFIESMFPQYDKILYLDCDIVVLGDVSELYFTDLEGNTIAGVIENWILHSPIFSLYTKEAVGVESKNYINAGIMIMDLTKFREQEIEKRFTDLINTYNFNVIDPDQAYINYLCRGKIKYLSFSWNRTPLEFVECEKPNIVHYALGIKPWQNPDMFLGSYFWEYAEKSPFYEHITNVKNSFDDLARLKKEKAGIDIQIQAIEFANSENTFKKKLADSFAE